MNGQRLTMTRNRQWMAIAGAAALAGINGAAQAQTTTPVIPDDYSLPEAEPTPTPTPTPTPPVMILPAPPAVVPPAPTPMASPRLRVTASPQPRPQPEPSPGPSAAPEPAASPSPVVAPPSPAPQTEPRPAPTRARKLETAPVEPVPMGEGAGTAPAPDSSTGFEWWAGALIAALLLAGVAIAARLLVRRRQAEGSGAEVKSEVAETLPVTPAFAPSLAPDRPAVPRLTIDFRPSRAGINLLTATVMGEILLANTGEVPVERVLVDARLISAHDGQDGEIAAIHAGPLGRALAPALALAPGETRRLSVVAALPHAGIRPIQAGSRAMFVPVIVITAALDVNGVPARAGRAFVVGIEREGSAKLAPIWLDDNARMHDRLAARPHGEGIAG